MNRHLFRILLAANRHRAWTTAFLAVVVMLCVGGGVAAGMSRPAPTGATIGTTAELERAGDRPPVTVQKGVVSLNGVIVNIGPRALRVRLDDGRVVTVATPDATKYRKAGKDLRREELLKGALVVILGRSQDNGNFRATSVTVRGQVATPAPRRTPPAATPVARTPRPSISATPQP